MLSLPDYCQRYSAKEGEGGWRREIVASIVDTNLNLSVTLRHGVRTKSTLVC